MIDDLDKLCLPMRCGNVPSLDRAELTRRPSAVFAGIRHGGERDSKLT